MKILRAIIGIILVFAYHLPKLIWNLAMLSYYSVFGRQDNLTANPKEHLRRAENLLNKNRNSLLLYAALEIRLAAERIIENQLMFSEKVSMNAIKKSDPVKHTQIMEKIDPDSLKEHEIRFTIKETGETIHWGNYKPVELARIKEIKNRLGDLLHAKKGIRFGIAADPWYKETREWLRESLIYLKERVKDNNYYFSLKNVENFELIKKE